MSWGQCARDARSSVLKGLVKIYNHPISKILRRAFTVAWSGSKYGIRAHGKSMQRAQEKLETLLGIAQVTERARNKTIQDKVLKYGRAALTIHGAWGRVVGEKAEPYANFIATMLVGTIAVIVCKTPAAVVCVVVGGIVGGAVAAYNCYTLLGQWRDACWAATLEGALSGALLTLIGKRG